MSDTTENEYLEMANHAKELIDRKEKIIDFHKQRLIDIEEELRVAQYLISNMTYLTEYAKKIWVKTNDKHFIDMLLDGFKKVNSLITESRNMTEIDSDDEEIALLVS